MVKMDIEMPGNCWDCPMTAENLSGLTYCCVTGIALYPMGTDLAGKRMNSCPLIDDDKEA